MQITILGRTNHGQDAYQSSLGKSSSVPLCASLLGERPSGICVGCEERKNHAKQSSAPTRLILAEICPFKLV